MDSGERQRRNISTVQNGGWARRNDGEIRGLFLSLIKVGRTFPRDTIVEMSRRRKVQDKGPDGLTTDQTDLSCFLSNDIFVFITVKTISFLLTKKITRNFLAIKNIISE